MSIRDGGSQRHIVHLTSAHGRYDIRIFQKQCRSLARAGYRVSLVVADGKGDEVTRDGIAIHDVGRPKGRLDRIFRASSRVAKRGRSLGAELYQFHDPELMPAGLAFKRAGKRVVFDSHEDVPKQMLGKPYLNRFLLRILAKLISGLESWTVRRLDAVIGATPFITRKFASMAGRVENVNNFPELGELESGLPWSSKANEICYVGGIAEIRGILPLVEALGQTKTGARLNLVGAFSEADTQAAAKALPSWNLVNELGVLGRGQVREVMARSLAGVVTFAPLPNHVDAQPNKMFEYMSAGIPVIASDFPLWREIIVGHDCGLCVDPGDPNAIARAIDQLAGNPDRAAQMGRNGQAAVRDKFNWAPEERKLVQLYEEILA